MEQPVHPLGEKLSSKIHPVDFLGIFFSQFNNFAKKYLPLKHPPYLYIVIWFLGMATIIDQFEEKFFVQQEYALNNWEVVWPVILIGGFFFGYIGYWIGGAIYHIRVWICGGAKNIIVSRNLYLYTGIPIYLVSVFSEIANSIIYGNKYFIEPTNIYFDITWGIISVGAIIYSIILSYRGVRLLQKTKLIRSIIFFLVLPILFYTLAIGAIAFSIYSRYSQGLEYNDQAIQAMYEQRYDEAEKLFNKAITKMDKDDKENFITIYTNMGVMYDNQEKYEQAIDAYKTSLSYDSPETLQYHSNMGNINILNGNIDRAIENFEKALELNSDDFNAHNKLGLIYMGEMDESLKNFKKAFIHNKKAYNLSGDVTTIQNLALNYYLLEDYEESLHLFESLNKMIPNNSFAKYFLGVIYYINEDYNKAKDFLKKAIQLDPALDNEDVQYIFKNIDLQLKEE